ncbi:MAG: sulfatase-like hydrolase/transferase [Bacteroidales bacterium]|nr:sulfatase-like hydrolase/transferase [Bacteroidales bacterium]
MKKRIGININHGIGSCLLTFAYNMLLVYIVYMLCRVIFIFENWSLMGQSALCDTPFWLLLKGSLMFDTSAILLSNSLYAVMMLFPCHWKEKAAWQTATKWVFVVVNSLAIIVNLCDCVYVQFTGRRTTTTVFSEFQHEGNLGSIFGHEIISHWYLVLLGVAMTYALWKVYRKAGKTMSQRGDETANETRGRGNTVKRYVPYYVLHTVVFVLFVFLTIGGIRGGFSHAVRPITNSNAAQYVKNIKDAPVVLNTSFSLLRTIGKKAYPKMEFFTSEELDRIYSPLKMPRQKDHATDAAPHDSVTASTASFFCPENINGKKNVVILIVESFGREFIGAYNRQLDGGTYKGYTPFIDSLYQHSLSFDLTFANGRKSIDAMPSILASIPMFIEPYITGHAAMNDVNSIASELGRVGYSSAFYHGAENGSMGFQAFANTTGFQAYYGRDEYNADKRFKGDADFDGTWAIWDEPFLQFFALKTSEQKEPFVNAVFTASSHHPFAVPETYKERFKEEGDNVLHKCIRYTDYSLQRYFETASKQPWFKNTLFVITSDHTNQPDHDEYKTDMGLYEGSILFYDPSGEVVKPGRRHCIAQQIDIMPTILGLLQYDKPYIAFGNDLTQTTDKDTWAVSYNGGVYQLVKDDWLVQFDGEQVKALYNIKNDPLLQHDVASRHPDKRDKLNTLLKAVMQSYMTRMNSNTLVVNK